MSPSGVAVTVGDRSLVDPGGYAASAPPVAVASIVAVTNLIIDVRISGSSKGGELPGDQEAASPCPGMLFAGGAGCPAPERGERCSFRLPSRTGRILLSRTGGEATGISWVRHRTLTSLT